VRRHAARRGSGRPVRAATLTVVDLLLNDFAIMLQSGELMLVRGGGCRTSAICRLSSAVRRMTSLESANVKGRMSVVMIIYGLVIRRVHLGGGRSKLGRLGDE
jgi:hypothetical protein